MTTTDTTAPSQFDTLRFEFELAHPPQKVWRALTEPRLLAEWLLPVVEGQLTAGQHFVFQTQAYPGWDGTVRCQVVEREELQRLSYTWVVGDMELDTRVTFTLTETEHGTLLSLVQSGFKPSQKQNVGGARYGWKMMGDKLAALLAGDA